MQVANTASVFTDKFARLLVLNLRLTGTAS